MLKQILLLNVAGFSREQWAQYRRRLELRAKWEHVGTPEPLPQKTFSKTHDNLSELRDYSGSLPESYWETWTKKSYDALKNSRSWISPTKLLAVAREAGYTCREGRVRRAMERLRFGADIGCRGDGRLPTEQRNSRSAFQFGVRVADSLQGWIKDGLCFGPMDREEMPWKEYTVNPITVKLKPNGKARICIIMSAPYKTDSQPVGTPSSVNSGIDKEEFPTLMASTPSFFGFYRLVPLHASW